MMSSDRNRRRDSRTIARNMKIVTEVVAVTKGQFSNCSKGAAETTRKMRDGSAK